ncbi:tetraacyldisaccharide 4'-kinase [Dissulfuribacter thermophilus]|uniref:tetraacyldisaccharide 4'-kinase n=1 Tax=Dissulfuribacter thermophilus TaxID=1156395 RepID=UPI000ACBF8EA|nr:tetraacyldisaccharide 4'-kinase [Dissulfuribacter thermophilus]
MSSAWSLEKLHVEDILFTLGRPLSPIYGTIMSIRRNLYKRGILPSFSVKVPVISIGNILLGGTGKTPHVEMLTKWLLEKDIVPAIISRGYGGKVGKGPRLLFDGKKIHFGPDISGDEPYMMALNLKYYLKKKGLDRGPLIIIGSDRVSGAKEAIRYGAQTIILDDGFQHLRLKRDLDILLFPYNVSLNNLKIFPGGRLREPISSLMDCDCIILTKCPDTIDEQIISALTPYCEAKSHFFSKYMSTSLEPLIEGQSYTLEYLRGKKVGVFSGIADPGSFESQLLSLGARIVGSQTYRDHYSYSYKDLLKLAKWAQSLGADLLLTTQKDLVKLRSILMHCPHDNSTPWPKIYALAIEASVEDGFFELIKKTLERGVNVSNGTPE